MGQKITEHWDVGAKFSKAEPEKYQGRAAKRKIGKIIRRCKADIKAIERLDDEQKEYLERMRKKF
jgi:hypothetical protein